MLMVSFLPGKRVSNPSTASISLFGSTFPLKKFKKSKWSGSLDFDTAFSAWTFQITSRKISHQRRFAFQYMPHIHFRIYGIFSSLWPIMKGPGSPKHAGNRQHKLECVVSKCDKMLNIELLDKQLQGEALWDVWWCHRRYETKCESSASLGALVMKTSALN